MEKTARRNDGEAKREEEREREREREGEREVSCKFTRVVFLGVVADKIGPRVDGEYPVPTFEHV